MATWSSILAKSAALLNDQARDVYTDAVLLAYLNLSLLELQEIFELNNIPVTNEVSASLTVPAGTTAIGFSTIPALPTDLVEIQQLFESQVGQEVWIPMVRKNFLLPSLLPQNQPVAMFGVWSWIDQEIRLPVANQDNDLKIDYIKTLFTELTIGELGNQNTILNTDVFFTYRVAAFAAEFIDENLIRADKLNMFGAAGLERSLGISVKGQQAITIRRRPFRAAYKRNRTLI